MKKPAICLAVAAALCVSVFGSSSASALSITDHECLSATGTPTASGLMYPDNRCLNGTTEPNKTFTWVPFVELTGVEAANPSEFTIASTIAGVKFKVACKALSGSGNVIDEGESIVGTGIVQTYSSCAVTEPAEKKCQVKTGGGPNGTIKTNSLKSVTTRTGAESYATKYTPTSGTAFVTVEVNGCTVEALNGSKEVTGSATAVSKVGMETATKQEFTATSGSELKFGGQAATILGSSEQAHEGNGVGVGP